MASTPAVGALAPLFETYDANNHLVRLEDFRGKNNVVLFFFPKSFTPGCTAQVCSFRDAYSELTGKDAVLLGVSLDRAERQQQFAQAFQLPFALLTDPNRTLSRAYGAIGPLGALLGMNRRVTFVIDKEGVLRGVFRHDLAIGRHLEDVRRALASLS
jgi:thioredoxin-dependent peroxiredoxin